MRPRLGGSPHLSWKRDQDKRGDYMSLRVTLPKRVTSPTYGPLPCKQALNNGSPSLLALLKLNSILLWHVNKR